LQGLQVERAKDPEIIRLMQLEMGLWGVMCLMSIALIIIGVGVWRHREAARKAMLVWPGSRYWSSAAAWRRKPLRSSPRRQAAAGDGGRSPARHGPQRTEPGADLQGEPHLGHLRRSADLGALPIIALALLSRPSVRDRMS